jgi:aryl-alcohol dehydrogenase-like predicted oxidoreductase
MSKKNENIHGKTDLNRRDFMKDISLGVAGVGLLSTQLSCSGLNIFGKKGKASTMNYRKLGRTGLKVSEIGLGGHYDGPNNKQKKSREQWQRDAVFQECLKNGINYFDTNSEYERESFGLALKSMPGIREQITLVTDINDRKNTGPETYDFLMHMIDVQLKNLQLPSVDIFRFTTVIKRTPPERVEAAIRAFKQMKKDGKVKYLAVSQHDPDLLLEWVKKYDEIDIIYIPYNYFAPKAEEELLPLAKKKDIGIVVIKPFNKGTIFDPKLIETMKFGSGSLSVIERAEKERQERTPDDLTKGTEFTLAQASLRYILSNENITSVIPGMETIKEVRENLAIVDTVKFSEREQIMLQQYSAHFHKVLPENYQWLKCWKHA